MPSAVVIIVALCSCILYLACNALYNLYFHPLAKFPGPRLAASTKLYEFYYDVIQGGQFFYEIQRMHTIYGRLLRLLMTSTNLTLSEVQLFVSTQTSSTSMTLRTTRHFMQAEGRFETSVTSTARDV